MLDKVNQLKSSIGGEQQVSNTKQSTVKPNTPALDSATKAKLEANLSKVDGRIQEAKSKLDTYATKNPSDLKTNVVNLAKSILDNVFATLTTILTGGLLGGTNTNKQSQSKASQPTQSNNNTQEASTENTQTSNNDQVQNSTPDSKDFWQARINFLDNLQANIGSEIEDENINAQLKINQEKADYIGEIMLTLIIKIIQN